MNEWNYQLRLQKFLAFQGVCSRRKAEERIRKGEVQVNGKIARVGQKIDPCKDSIFMGSTPVVTRTMERIVLLMHKPKGVVCTHADPFHERTVFDLLPRVYRKRRLFCVGRLDKASEGLLIFTNDGALCHCLTHPSHQVVKGYRVVLNHPFDEKGVPRLIKGIQVDGDWLRVDKVVPIRTKEMTAGRRLDVYLHQGHKREIRRLFEALHYRVTRLIRFQIGSLRLVACPYGSVRPLSQREISALLGQKRL